MAHTSQELGGQSSLTFSVARTSQELGGQAPLIFSVLHISGVGVRWGRGVESDLPTPALCLSLLPGQVQWEEWGPHLASCALLSGSEILSPNPGSLAPGPRHLPMSLALTATGLRSSVT